MATDLNGLASGRIGASLIPVLPEGLDLTRCVLGRAPGYFTADSSATILAGQVVTREASGMLVLCTGANPIGLAKWNQANATNGVAIQEAIVLTGTSAVNLKHANVSKVLVIDAVTLAPYTVATDYTVSATNGTVTRVGSGSIPNGGTVLVSYMYAASPTDYQFNGLNFFNFVSDSAQTQGRLTVVQSFSTIFSAAYDTSQQWAVNDVVTCGTDGYPTLAGGGAAIGIVIQVPTADDPYLGFNLTVAA